MNGSTTLFPSPFAHRTALQPSLAPETLWAARVATGGNPEAFAKDAIALEVRDSNDDRSLGAAWMSSRSLTMFVLFPHAFPIIEQSRLLAPQNPVGKASTHAPKDFMLSDLLLEIEQTEAEAAAAKATHQPPQQQPEQQEQPKKQQRGRQQQA